jgi:hypothetical protein
LVAVLHQRRLGFDGLSIVLLRSAYAEALAVEAPPSVEAAATASRFVHQGRSDRTLNPNGVLGVAFSGCERPGRQAVDELREACVYIVSADLSESAVDNARSFLADVEGRMPEVMRIFGSAGFSPDPLLNDARPEPERPKVALPGESVDQIGQHRKG